MKKRVRAIIDSLERQGIDVTGIDSQLEDRLSGVHLRFDREALRFIDDVQTALRENVPAGTTLVFTITAPLRLASKTADTLERTVRGALARRSTRVDLNETINGNRIRVRLVKGVSDGRVIGFVHNPDSDSDILFKAVQRLLEPARSSGRSGGAEQS